MLTVHQTLHLHFMVWFCGSICARPIESNTFFFVCFFFFTITKGAKIRSNNKMYISSLNCSEKMIFSTWQYSCTGWVTDDDISSFWKPEQMFVWEENKKFSWCSKYRHTIGELWEGTCLQWSTYISFKTSALL